MPSFFAFVLFASAAVGAELRIGSVEKFVQFKNNVSKGTSYSGTTVLLDSDLSFTGKSFEPIGDDYYNYFGGVFDGQGHVISNLAMTSKLEDVGLFGYSRGLTIKNVILDFSCFITSSFNSIDESFDAYVGGIIGYCYAGSRPCSIENSVNMASVTFRLYATSHYLHLGGIAGYLYSSSRYCSTVKNCANYGDVTHSGYSYYSQIGGIIGRSYGSSSARGYIYNSLNHGTIKHNGTTSTVLSLGGIIGVSSYTTIENCVSGGNISYPKAYDISSIAGGISLDSSINYTYITSALSGYRKYETGTPSESNVLRYDSTTFELTGTVSIGSYTGTSLIDALNAAADYYTPRDYSYWFINKGNNSVSFTINENSTFTLNTQVILLPSLASEGRLGFDGWYTDKGLTTPLSKYEVTGDTELYGKFGESTNNYTISFDTRREGVSIAPITAQFGTVVTLPSELQREHWVVASWENKHGDYVGLSLTMPSHDITLYAVWGCTHIGTPEDFSIFADSVNRGANYLGTTVFLESDLFLAGEKTFGPIGTYPNYFSGVFDGQGHVISNLTITSSSSQEVGLFGFSRGLTAKNVVLDSSCSVTSSFRGSNDAWIGGIIGDCYASDGPSIIENSVNMGGVTFNGNTGSYYLYLGGIAGRLYSDDYDITVKNCANYGDVTHSGEDENSYIGGVVGYSSGSSSDRAYIYNCLNHGTITHSGTSSNLYLGGIAGDTKYTSIENCVSGGKISLFTTVSSGDNSIGSIVGRVYSGTSINFIYFTSDLSGYNKYGFNTPSNESNTLSYDSTTFELNGTASIGSYTGSSLIGALNAAADYYALRDYSRWLLNKGNNAVSFTINGRTNPIKMNYKAILTPSLASEGKMTFDGWYTDDELTTPLTEYEVTSETELYGRFEEGINYAISFETRREGLSVAPITGEFNSVITLPSDLVNEYCVIAWWETKYGFKIGFNLTMPSHNITLYAVWKCTRIETSEDFIVFFKVVNNGVDSFNGTTVFLDSDLSFDGKSFEPIGNSSKYFRGVFDGQGHVISNLNMTSSSLQYAGLFGYSTGLTIRNVILDSSCSITSSFSDSGYSAYVGGIIGHCKAENGPCIIENSVNMGSVTFSGNASGNSLYLGGIVGYFKYSSGYISTVKNCANYGDVTHSGESSDSYIGGIVGYSWSGRIYNCLNHGTITHSGTTTSNLHLGGIIGYTEYTTIENCVSGGKISLSTTASGDNYTGSIVGYVHYGTSINYCYYTSDLSGYKKYGGSGTPSVSNTLSYDNTSFDLNGTVSIGNYTGSSLIYALNAAADYYNIRDYSHWLLNKGNNDVAFIINGRTSPIKMDSQIILLPSLASEGNMTYKWHTDKECTTLLNMTTVEEDITLYGKYWNESEDGNELNVASSLFPHATFLLLLLLSSLISLVAF